MDATRHRYLKCEEAAEYLSVSPWTLRHWVCERRVPFIRVGRMVRFRLEDLERFMNSGLVRVRAGSGSEG
jgi:excisionase family DNA binding protein